MARYGSYHREPLRVHLRKTVDADRTYCGRKGWALKRSYNVGDTNGARAFHRDPNRCERCCAIHADRMGGLAPARSKEQP